VKVIDLCRLLLCGQVSASAVPELGDPDIRAEVEQQLAAVGVGLRYAEADRCWVALVDEPLPDEVGLAPIQALNETERAVAAASWLHLVFLPAERRAAATLDGLSLPAEPTERPSIDPDDLYGQFAHLWRRQYFDIVTGRLKRLGFLRLRDGRLEAGPVLAVLGEESAIAEARRVVAVHKRFLLLRRQAAEITAELGLEPAAAASSVDPQPTSASPNGGPPGGSPATVGQRVRAARVVLGWSQALLAERAGLDQARVSRIERGEQPPPGVAESLATALGLGPEELGGDGGEHAAG
jgi:hypothetical protein